MNEAIKLAIEKGGWTGAELGRFMPALDIERQLQEDGFTERVVMSPLFWQALGEALEYEGKAFMPALNTVMEDWRWWAHRYFDLLLIRGDTGKFWEELLTSRQ